MRELPEKIGLERLNELTEKIRTVGITPDEETEIVNGNLRLLISLANRWCVISPHLRDVFVADGMYALLLAIRDAPKKLREKTSLTQYIIIRITTAFKKAVNQQHAVKAPLQDRLGDKTTVKKGKTYITKKVKLKRLPLPNESEEESTKTPKKIPSQLLVTQDFYDLREIISMSVTTKFEEAVLKLKEYGYNRSEIAELLKSRPKEITETMEVIEFRLRRLLKDNHYGSYT